MEVKKKKKKKKKIIDLELSSQTSFHIKTPVTP
jgi:hypothetical protein